MKIQAESLSEVAPSFSLVIHNHRPTRAQAFPELHALQGQDVSGGQEEVTYSVGEVEGQDGVKN
ncbi:hypothetical protein JCM31598_17630 [Desulfonatronum parangueonense]